MQPLQLCCGALLQEQGCQPGAREAPQCGWCRGKPFFLILSEPQRFDRSSRDSGAVRGVQADFRGGSSRGGLRSRAAMATSAKSAALEAGAAASDLADQTKQELEKGAKMAVGAASDMSHQAADAGVAVAEDVWEKLARRREEIRRGHKLGFCLSYGFMFWWVCVIAFIIWILIAKDRSFVFPAGSVDRERCFSEMKHYEEIERVQWEPSTTSCLQAQQNLWEQFTVIGLGLTESADLNTKDRKVLYETCMESGPEPAQEPGALVAQPQPVPQPETEGDAEEPCSSCVCKKMARIGRALVPKIDCSLPTVLVRASCF